MKTLHLGYHYLRDKKAPGPTCSPDRLEKQIRALLAGGYEVITCGEVVRRIMNGMPLPDKHATLSFDDGLRDQYAVALPILRKFDVPATFFVITSAFDGRMPPTIGFQVAIEKLGAKRLEEEILPQLFHEYGLWSYRALLDPKRFDASGMKMGEPPEMRRIKAVFNHFVPPSLQAELIRRIYEGYAIGDEAELVSRWFMNRGELAEMAEKGMEIASHSDRHPWLNMIGEEEIGNEALRSRAKIAEVIGSPPKSAGWTFGSATPRKEAQAAVARAGYTSAWNFWSTWSIEYFQKLDTYLNLMDIPRLHEQAFNP